MDQPAVALAPVGRESSVVPGQRSRPRWPGILAFVLGVLTVAGLATGLVLVTADSYQAATWTAWVATATSVVAIVVGLAAVVGRFGRGWAVVGLIVAVVANPPVLTRALDVIGGPWA